MELVQLSIGQLLRQTAERWPNRPAVQNENVVLNWKQCLQEVRCRASFLLSHKIGKGSHIGMLVPNSVEAFLMMLACWDIGVVTVMLNTSLTAEELVPLLKLTETEILISGGERKETRLMDTVRQIQEQYRCKTVLDVYQPLKTTEDYTSVLRAEAEVQPSDYAAILFTSGTTSTPKAVPSTHFMRVNNGRIQARDQDATEQDKFCVAIPLFHCFGMTANLLSAIAVGACICFPRSNRTIELMKTIETMRCTVLTCVPTLYFAMMARPDFNAYDISSLRTGLIGGAAYTPEQFIRIEEQFGFRLLSSLGQTEATAGITVCNPTDSIEVRSTTVGHFMEHLEGCIFDSEGGRLPLYQQGEICVRGYSVMEGYYHSPAQTAEVIDTDGWLHTGDTGYLDTCGNVHLTGRLKDLVIRGGENIAPAEIELCLVDVCPEIQQIKVIGVPDSHYGEELCACVQLRPGKSLGEVQLRRAAAERLAYYKIPKYILFMELLPTTASGKIRSTELRKICIAQLTEQGNLPR